MSSRRYDGQNYVDTSSQKRYDGANWIDVSSIKRFDGSNWIETLSTPMTFTYTEGSNVRTFTIANTSTTIMNWAMTLTVSSYNTYAFITTSNYTLSANDVVVVKARNLSISSGTTITVQSKTNDGRAATIGSILSEVSFTASSTGVLCFKITRSYNGASSPSGSLEVEYIKINGKQYKPVFTER